MQALRSVRSATSLSLLIVNFLSLFCLFICCLEIQIALRHTEVQNAENISRLLKFVRLPSLSRQSLRCSDVPSSSALFRLKISVLEVLEVLEVLAG